MIARAIGDSLETVLAVTTSATDPAGDLQQRLRRLPFLAPTGFGVPASWPTILSTDNEADARARVRGIPSYIPAPRYGAGLGALPAQPSGWPQHWSTEGEIDLQSRLARLPFYSLPTPALPLPNVPMVQGGPAGLGGVTEDLQTILQKAPDLLAKLVKILNAAGPHLDTVLQISLDPALPQIVARLKTLQASAAAKPSTPAAPGAAPTTDSGVSKLIPALDAAIFLDRHPAAQFAIDHPILVGAGAFVILTGIGFGIGRLSKRCRTASPAVGRRYRRRR